MHFGLRTLGGFLADIALHRDAILEYLVPQQGAVKVYRQINDFGARARRLVACRVVNLLPHGSDSGL